MSNEYKDWLRDKIGDIVLDYGLADKITYTDDRIVEGLKNKQPVRYEVWFDLEQYEWKIEHRELGK